MPIDNDDIVKIRQLIQQDTADLKQYVRVDGPSKFERPIDFNRQEAKGLRLHNMTSTERLALFDLQEAMIVEETDTGRVYFWSQTNGWETCVRLDGDTMTGQLILSPDTDVPALCANNHIKLLAGKKLILDGTCP